MTSVDAEALIRECVPGGSICDPQQVADAIRAYFVDGVDSQNVTDHLEIGMAGIAQRLCEAEEARDEAVRVLRELVRVEELSARGSDRYDPEECADAWRRARDVARGVEGRKP